MKFKYNGEEDKNMTKYLKEVRKLPKDAKEIMGEAFPKLQFLGKQPKIPQFCKAEGLKNCKSLSKNHARERIVNEFWDRPQKLKFLNNKRLKKIFEIIFV
jgi:hypothetical protein